jgi:hypothetical protein
MSILSPAEINTLLATNADFRAEYIANPKPILAQFGQVYPESTEVTIVESKLNAIALIIGDENTYPPAQIASMPPQVAAVLKRSFVDSEFKSLLMNNPVEAIFLETGFRVPESTTVKTYETTTEHIYLPLVESAEETEQEELSDLELEQVAGGKSKAGSAISHFFTSTVPATAAKVGNAIVGGAQTANNAANSAGYGQVASLSGLSTVANIKNCPYEAASFIPGMGEVASVGFAVENAHLSSQGVNTSQ